MELRVLGPLEVIAEGQPLALGPPKQRAVLALLLIHNGEVVSTDRLLDGIWGESPPPSARQALRLYISQLRRILQPATAPGVILTRRPGYLLEIESAHIDAHRFERALAMARDSEDPITIDRLLGEALQLWRGPPYADFTYDDFAAAEINRLEELRLEAVDRHIAAELELGRHSEVLGRLEPLIADHPLRESLRASQMLALYRSGRQAEALRAFREARQLLGEELGIEPGEELCRLEDRILLHDEALLHSSVPISRHNLPTPAAGFVGRADALDRLCRLVQDERIVTVDGPPGVGKTRTAIEATYRLVDQFPHGVWFVDLAPVTDPALVAPAIAAAVGVRDQDGADIVERLATFLGDRRLLLLLDNCEHLLDAVAGVVTDVAPRSPGLHVVVTSREKLRIAGEFTFPLAPMSVPDPHLAFDEAGSFDAVQLFIDRAHAAHPGFEFDANTAPAVVRVCARLDGIPLAIELAAVKVRSLSIADIADRLDDRFHLLSKGQRGAPAHQATLEAAVAWSYELATPSEQRLFRRMSVFVGGFGGEDAAAVLSGDGLDAGTVVDTLSSLVEKSLLAVETAPGGAVRYRTLETMRQYGRDRLVAGEGTDTSRRHAVHFASLAEQANARLDGPDQVAWMERLAEEQDNLRAALGWLQRDDAGAGLRLAASLGPYWTRHGDWSEGRHWLGHLLDADAAMPAGVAGRALHMAGTMALLQNDREEATRQLTTGLDLLERVGDLDGAARAVNTLAGLAIEVGDVARARRLYEESLDLNRRAGTSETAATINLGWLALEVDDRDEARRRFESAGAGARAEGDVDTEAWSCLGLGVLAWLDGDLAAAESLFDISVGHWEKLDARPSLVYGHVGQALVSRDRGEIVAAAESAADAVQDAMGLGGGERYAFCLGIVVSVLAAADRSTEVARLIGALLSLAGAHGWPIWSWYRRHLDGCQDAARSRLGADRFAEVTAEGEAMSLGDALRHARQAVAPPAES
ncbi:MAG: AAA family ATPase [Acidimicrobiia bacterium]|nr:AAA family ATPase [Acidimicrobiia bacterium]